MIFRKTLPWLTAFLFMCALKSQAQTSANYSATSTTNASLIADKNGNTIDFSALPNLISNNATTENALLAGIGFDLIFMGRRYTHFIAGGDGMVGLGLSNSPAGMISSIPNNNMLRFVNYPPTIGNDAPVLAAFWDDIRTARTGATVRSLVTGNAPNRCLVIQWNMVINSASVTNTNPADGVFQMRLYEGSGEIEYVYGQMKIGAGSGTVTASIGFTAGFTDNTFLGVTNLNTFAVSRLTADQAAMETLVNASTPGSITQLSSVADGSRRRVSITPITCVGNFTSSSITRVYARTMQLNWTDTIHNKLGYLIYRSEVAPNNYTYYTSLPANATQYIATGLNTNTRYFWKVIPYSEGNTQTVLDMNDSTRCSMTGTYSVGPSGQFLNIRNAQDSLELWGIVGNSNWELNAGYNFSTETLPVRFNQLPPCHEFNNTITVRPATGVNISYTRLAFQPVFLVDSVKNIIIDGRAGGTGNTPALALESDGELIRIQNGWNNTIRYTELRSNSNSTTGPLVVQASLGGGAHHNTIEYNLLHDRGNTFNLPTRFLIGLASNNAENKLNTVRQNNFYNWSGLAMDISGNGWRVDSNSFYATRAVTMLDSSGFIHFRTADQNFTDTLRGNHFGGTDVQSGGNVMQLTTGTSFNGVKLSGNALFTNNRFRKLRMETSITPSAISSSIILLQTGVPGTQPFPVHLLAQQNQFGGSALADSIYLLSSTAKPARLNIIYNLDDGQAIIKQNDFLNIRTKATGNTDMSFSVIETFGNAITIDSNRISSTDHLLRIRHGGDSPLTGIHTYGNASINGNTITNISANRIVTGISTQANYSQITNNLISHIKSMNGEPTFSYYTSAGIAAFASHVNISRNRIISIEDSSDLNSNGPTGILAKECICTVDRNLIDGLIQYPYSTIAKSMTALEVEDDYTTFSNNMVRLGLDTAGNTVTRGLFTGYTNSPVSTSTLKHNSIYIGGTNASNANNGGAYCIFWQGLSVVQNNILSNERTYQSGNLSAIYLASSQAQGAYLDYNAYYHAPGLRFSTDVDSFNVWRNPTRDPHSVFLTPNFVNRNAPSRLLDLHVTGQTPAEGRGTPSYTNTEDFDGETRDNFSPIDIGADAGNYTPVDLNAPSFIIVPLGNAPDTVSRYITIHITDSLAGLSATGNNRPTIWYRKKYPTVTPWQTSFGTLVAGNVHSGDWQFFINHQLLNVSENGADSIQYYFVAQDTATYPHFNLAVSPAEGADHISVTQQVTAPTTPYIYRINVGRYIIPPVVNIGLNQKYQSLTGDGGLFEGLHVDSVQGDITARIVSHLSESGNWALDSVLTRRHIKLTIVPSFDTVFYIRNNGDLSREMIRLYNADNVTIDGSYNGSGRWLRFINTHSVPANGKATLALFKGTDSLLVKNSEWQNNLESFNTQAIVTLQDENCNDDRFINNLFSNASGYANPSTGIFTPFTATPGRVLILKNHFQNITRFGVFMNGQADDIRVDSNHFYWNDPLPQPSTEYIAINLTGSTSQQQANGNYIGGSQPFCGGSAWQNNADFSNFYGIQMGAQSDNYSHIENNIIRNIKTTSADASNFFPIVTYGKIIINNNTIGDSTITNSLDIASISFTGIYSTLNRHLITNNLISGINCTNTIFYALAQGIFQSTDSSSTIRNNIIRNISSASGAQFSSSPALSGISVLTHAPLNDISQNQIFNLRCTNTIPVPIAGIHLNADNNAGMINRNRIWNLTEPNSVNGSIIGIYLQQTGDWDVSNNQITLTNGSSTNPVHIYGINDSTFLGNFNNHWIEFNSILIGGNQTGNSNSFGYRNSGTGRTAIFKNNLLMNERTGGAGQHGAVSIESATPATSWLPNTANYNMYAVKDTNSAFRWGFNTAQNIHAWRVSSQTDQYSFAMQDVKMPAGRLFNDSAKGNLDINVNDSICWYLNGRGLPINYISDDYGATNVRSTTGSAGAVDIGSDEFNTATTPPVLRMAGNHVNGGTDSLYFNGNLTATLTWSAAGTLPQINSARFYAGTWPNDTTNNGTVTGARYMNGYLIVNATGGSGYSYDLKLFYDSTMKGKVTNFGTVIMNKKQTGTAGTWTDQHPTLVNTTARTISVFNLTSFSEFTASDTLATLGAPTPMPDLVITGQSVNPASAPTGSSVNVVFTETNNGNAPATLAHKVNIYISADNVLTPGANGDLLLTQQDITATIAAGGNSGQFTKSASIPCTVPAGTYFIFIVADGQAQVTESNETNNAVSVSLTVTNGTVVPSVTIGYTGCPSTTLNFQATPVNGGATPQYQWLVNNVISGTGVSFTLNNAVNGMVVKCVMTSSAVCATPQTANATETINCIATAVPQVDGLESFYIAPNPTKGLLRIQLKLANSRKMDYSLFDLNGKRVLFNTPVNVNGNVNRTIDMTSLPNGVYILRIGLNNQQFSVMIMKAE